MRNITTEEDIDSLVGLSFEQLLQRMVDQADAIRVGSDRVTANCGSVADGQRLTGASIFAKALADRLSQEYMLGRIEAVEALKAFVPEDGVKAMTDAVVAEIQKRGIFVDRLSGKSGTRAAAVSNLHIKTRP